MGAHDDHDRSEAMCIGPSVVEPGLATGCNYWIYSEVCGTWYLLFVICLSAGPIYHNLVAVKTPSFFTVAVAFATCLVGSC